VLEHGDDALVLHHPQQAAAHPGELAGDALRVRGVGQPRAGAAPDADGRDWDDHLYCEQLLAALEPRARAALWLHAAEQRSFADVARALGVPRATAYDLYQRALASVRRAA
jgi:DNA-directed RNA polymerase specialized sigma24 family protein